MCSVYFAESHCLLYPKKDGGECANECRRQHNKHICWKKEEIFNQVH